ncbi:MAG: hydrolase 2, exosortase A system-associated [Pseudomonadota bacterium]|nr:hydrolase 2, exosortase A system-associated [Pseudomonadota bacterium]
MHPFFLPGAAGTGHRLCLHHAPAVGAARALVLYLHPFAEEMNKSRRMAALQSRALAAAGFAVLQIDLQGCGDSSGDFADASWQGWLDDAARGVEWLRNQHGADLPLWLWGLRAGALLAAQAAAQLQGARTNLLLWQPPASGKTLLQQFLRLKTVGGLQGTAEAGSPARPSTDGLRRELLAQRVIDVAGYALAPALALGLDAATLDLPDAVYRIVWAEVTSREPAALLPASAARVQAWQGAGRAVETHTLRGPAFWQTQEIEDAPALIDATVAALTREVVSV